MGRVPQHCFDTRPWSRPSMGYTPPDFACMLSVRIAIQSGRIGPVLRVALLPLERAGA